MLLRYNALFLLAFLLSVFTVSAQVKELKQWLALPATQRPELATQPFARKPLSQKKADAAKTLLLQDKKQQITIALQQEWAQKQFTSGDYRFKFEYKIFGQKPTDGRSLYISLHGGGGTTAQVNDQQWRNQINLYKPAEGIYVAPRAPTDSWNMWHQEHIDYFLDKLIQSAIVFEDVNPDKIYIMGYSAGGDGVFQLAPRLADRWAAAAMMAGHPGDASALNLRNIGFALQMGGKDAAYNRNGLAKKWEVLLDSLQKTDPTAFKHLVNIYPDKPHWMGRLDTVAVPWMAKFKRNPIPDKVVWVQDDVLKNRFYWLEVPAGKAKQHQQLEVTCNKNEINILRSDYDTFYLNLNDQLLNLNKPVLVRRDGKLLFKGKVNRNLLHIQRIIDSRFDPNLVFSAQLQISGEKVKNVE